MDTKDEQYHYRCIHLALNGLGRVAPNPLVGAVVKCEKKIIGEGFHHKIGHEHAEVRAIKSIKNVVSLKGTTLYVNLEPCSHYGKTPPCCDLIIEKHINTVVIGGIDPFPGVSGKGVKKLQNANIEVSMSLLPNLSRFINRRFFTFYEKKRPYIILKWAESFDGYIDKVRNSYKDKPKWITNTYAKILVHKWRTEEQAIVVGTDTVLFDNPQLTARLYFGKNPIRIIPDRKLRLPPQMNVFNNHAPTIVFTLNKNNIQRESSHTIVEIPFKNFPMEMLNYCYNNQIQSVIIEGGAKLLQSFIEQNLWDEARVFKGDIIFEKGVKKPNFPFTPFHIIRLENSILCYYFNDEWKSIANINYL